MLFILQITHHITRPHPLWFVNRNERSLASRSRWVTGTRTRIWLGWTRTQLSDPSLEKIGSEWFMFYGAYDSWMRFDGSKDNIPYECIMKEVCFNG